MKDIVLLKDYMNEGLVDYEKLTQDKWLIDEIEKIRNVNLIDLNKNDQFVFWLNTYNLLTLHSVLMEMRRNINWSGNHSLISKFRFFILRKHQVGNQSLSLHHIENKIIRKKFKDPRVHFALNCASNSCPYLPEKLFHDSNIEEYLEELTRIFINSKKGVVISENKLYLSLIFKWYKKDFANEGVIPFILKYWNGSNKLIPGMSIKYMKYDWALNSL